MRPTTTLIRTQFPSIRLDHGVPGGDGQQGDDEQRSGNAEREEAEQPPDQPMDAVGDEPSRASRRRTRVIRR